MVLVPGKKYRYFIIMDKLNAIKKQGILFENNEILHI